jgi:hypothetical protein
MNKIISYFTNDFAHWEKIDFFKRVLYVFLFLHTVSLLPAANDFFGYNGIGGTKGFAWSGSDAILNLLSHPINRDHTWIFWSFILGELIFLTLGYFRIKPKLSGFMIWFLTANLYLKGGIFFTGGEVLINLMLFYLMFIQKPDQSSASYELQNAINNSFYIILLIQVCILYFFSSYWKLYDDNWTNGKALYYISQIDSFSSDWMKSLFITFPTLSIIMTYTVLVYQGLFLILVWMKRFKVPFLIFGVCLHLGISIGMGIFAFGITMILTYILFLDIEQINRIKGFKLKR